MPKIDWIGKDAVVRHHNEVPYRLLHCNGKLSAGDADAGNLLVQGDNLEALKTLLPYYAGKVNCIYIDPPYNTGNEQWRYNDNVKSPQIQRWLDQVVGGEDEDLCRHDKWLCMMYPRLRLLREFLHKDGVIFVSIDDNEVHRLRMLLDEIFGNVNFVNTIIWQRASGGGNAKGIVTGHDYILVYQKDKNPIIDFRGDEVSRFPKSKILKKGGKTFFIDDDVVRKVFGPYPKGTERRCHYEELSEYKSPKQIAEIEEKIKAGEYILQLQPNGMHFICNLVEEGSRRKMYSILQGVLNSDGNDDIANLGISFPNPKPVELLTKLIASCDSKDWVIMDSFAGSGTTAHAVLSLNKRDEGNRRFILVEMDEKIASDATAKRIKRVIDGYGKDKKTNAMGGGFRFCTLGKPLFNEFGGITKEVKFSDLAAHIFFSETGSPILKKPKDAFIGMFEGQAIYLLYNGIMGDKSKEGGNMLTVETLHELPPHSGEKKARRVIYGEGCFLSPSRLQRENIVFKQIPYHIKTR